MSCAEIWEADTRVGGRGWLVDDLPLSITLSSFKCPLECGQNRASLIAQWVMNLPVKFQYQDYFFCHAGVDPDVPLAVQNEFDMLWRRQQWWEQYKGEETLVVGHTPVQKVMKLTGKERRTPKPLFLANHVIMCDTGAYMSGGKLSCVDVLAGKVWQA